MNKNKFSILVIALSIFAFGCGSGELTTRISDSEDSVEIMGDPQILALEAPDESKDALICEPQFFVQGVGYGFSGEGFFHGKLAVEGPLDCSHPLFTDKESLEMGLRSRLNRMCRRQGERYFDAQAASYQVGSLRRIYCKEGKNGGAGGSHTLTFRVTCRYSPCIY